ncbi:MAG: 50S ribosomal protein L1 [Nitriliruptorales bacterium]|nr:50S ribosomal protein L1 [Nitriliruptorales bacterium]
MGRGRKYREALARIDRERQYPAREGIALLLELNQANYDPTVDLAVRLGVDPRQADQMVRGAVSLPHGIGKTVRVAVVASSDKVAEARDAGADHAGGDDLVEQLSKGELIDELDSIIATPDMMGKLGRLGKVLGPRGLMPNPKSGTVTPDVAKAVGEIKSGRVEFRVDRQANIHAVLGKASFPAEALYDNYVALMDEIVRLRPASAKGRYVRSITVSTSTGPGIRLDPAQASAVRGADAA